MWVEGVAWSPDGTRIALSAVRQGDGSPGIYVVNVDGSGLTQLAIMGLTGNPAWSPDGSRIAFDAGAPEICEIYVVNADGTGLRQLTDNNVGDKDPDWSPDGTRIAFTSGLGGGQQIHTMAADGSQVTRLTSEYSEGAFFDSYMPAWSPDGSRIAFARRPLNPINGYTADIYVMAADGSGVTRVTQTEYEDDLWPAWRPRQP
jgi:TolB protein